MNGVSLQNGHDLRADVSVVESQSCRVQHQLLLREAGILLETLQASLLQSQEPEDRRLLSHSSLLLHDGGTLHQDLEEALLHEHVGYLLRLVLLNVDLRGKLQREESFLTDLHVVGELGLRF